MDRKIDVIKQALERKGFRAHTVDRWKPNKFGQTFIVGFHVSDDITISFVTNAADGRNYCKIHQVHNFKTDRTYISERYFYKYVALVSELNGSIFLLSKENEPTK